VNATVPLAGEVYGGLQVSEHPLRTKNNVRGRMVAALSDAMVISLVRLWLMTHKEPILSGFFQP
jgi:hypothetical protein